MKAQREGEYGSPPGFTGFIPYKSDDSVTIDPDWIANLEDRVTRLERKERGTAIALGMALVGWLIDLGSRHAR